MERCDGETPSKRPKLSDGGGGDDRLSALPDDVLIHILLKILDAAVAGRTSVLSKRWPRLWKLLPQLWFHCSTGPLGVRSALESHQAPSLHRLDVTVMDATPESVEAWLQIAARRLSGDLALLIKTMQQNETGGEAAEGGALELPCFENATSIRLELLHDLGLAMPSLGVFAGLTDLFLACIELTGPCMLGDVVSSPRCPVLKSLTVHNAWGLRNFTVHSDSLLEIELSDLEPEPDDALGLGNFTIRSKSLNQLKLTELPGLQQLNVMAPALILLTVNGCFASLGNQHQPVANISAPQLEFLRWNDAYDPRFTQLGKMENLQWLSTSPFIVYGRDGGIARKLNSYCLRLLQHVELIRRLSFTLICLQDDITEQQYLMEDISRLPKIARLSLTIKHGAHSFGASVFHVLRMCSGVRSLTLTLVSLCRHPEAQTACPSGCVCDQPPNWKTEQLALNRLREVKILDLGGTENEAALMQRLFDWATVVKKMTVTFHSSVNESTANKFWQILRSFSRPEYVWRGYPLSNLVFA